MWGVVVNDGLASGTTAIASRSCGCGEDVLPASNGKRTYETGNLRELADVLDEVRRHPTLSPGVADVLSRHDLRTTANVIHALYAKRAEPMVRPSRDCSS